MNREDFTEGSIAQAIFDHWEKGPDNEELTKKLMKFSKEELAEFITDAQSRGRFGNGFYHP